MDKKGLENTLIGLGLAEKEAQVYVALLSLGPATVLKTAQATELKRTTIYSIIESLKKKGLLNIEVRGFKKLFVAEDPSKLKYIIREQEERLKNALPEFEGLYNLGESGGFIKYYEGAEGIKTIYENLLTDMKMDDYYFVITDQKRWLDLDKKYFQNFIERRAKMAQLLKVKIQMLFQNSEIAREHQKYEKNYFEKIKILPVGTALTTNLVITPWQVIIHQLVPPITATVIKNKSIIQMHRELFEIIWESIKD